MAFSAEHLLTFDSQSRLSFSNSSMRRCALRRSTSTCDDDDDDDDCRSCCCCTSEKLRSEYRIYLHVNLQRFDQ